MASSMVSDNRPTYFYPASPANDSALQHCSTTEIQLASTSMTGIDGCMNETDSPLSNSRSTIFPALLNNTGLSMLDREDVAEALLEYVNTINSDSNLPLDTTTNAEGTDQSQKSNDRQENVASAARIRAFGLAKRLSGRSRTDLSESSQRSDSINATRQICRNDANMTATASPSRSVQVPKMADITTTFSTASPLPDMRRITSPKLPPITSTPLSKHLIAARGIMKDPNTPGSGQSVRFFSRDVYQTSLVTDFEATELHATRSTDMPAGVMSLSNLENTQSLLDASRTSLSAKDATRRSILMAQEPSHFNIEESARGMTSVRSSPHPMTSPDDSRVTRRTTSNSIDQQHDIHHCEDAEEVFKLQKSDVFGESLAVVPQTSKPASFPSLFQSASSISVSQRSFEKSNSFRDVSARSILANSTQANVTVYPPGAYNSKPDAKKMCLSNLVAIQATTDQPAGIVKSKSTTAAPQREIIVLDDSSGFSGSDANFTHLDGNEMNETVYLTPESSRRKAIAQDRSRASRAANTSHDTSRSQAPEEEIIEDVFSAHQRELAAIKKDRDGWKQLCTSLMEVTEASFSSNTSSGALVPCPNPGTNSLHRQSGSQESMAYHPKTERSTLTESEKQRTSRSFEAAGAQLRDDLRDLQIRLESKQKECDQERLRADRCQAQIESQQLALVRTRQENDILTRDTRDVDVKLELHARERESKVRQQLAEQMHDISSALETAQERNEELSLTIKQQQDQIAAMKLDMEAQHKDLDHQRNLAREAGFQNKQQSNLLQDLESEKEHARNLEAALEDGQETIRQLELQLEEAQARIQVATADEIQSLQEILAKELQRNNELSSLVADQEKAIQVLKDDMQAQTLHREKEHASRDQRIRELEFAYNEQVNENRDQYLQLEEAIEEREAKYAERLEELGVISDAQQHEIQRLQAKIEELQTGSTNTEELRRAEIELRESARNIAELSQSLAERSQRIKQYETMLAELKKKAANDVFESTKRERRIEKLLDDREMLNIAVEQLQIQIQLVKRQYKARTGKAWDEETQSSVLQDKSSRTSVSVRRPDRSTMTPLGNSRSINYLGDRR